MKTGNLSVRVTWTKLYTETANQYGIFGQKLFATSE